MPGLKLVAELGLDGRGFEAGLRRASALVSGGFKSAIAGAFTVGAVTGLAKKTIDYAGTLNDLSERLGVSTDFLQEFQFVAKQTGASLETLTKVMETLREARDKALGGDAKELAKFGAFGIGIGTLRNTRLEDLISGPIAKSFEHGDPQGRFGAAWRQLGGKGAGELVAGFTEGFNAGRQRAHAAGAVMSEDIIQQLDDIGDRFQMLGQQLLVAVAPVLLKMVDGWRRLSNMFDRLFAAIDAGTRNWSGRDWAANVLSFVAMGPLGRLLAQRLFPNAQGFDTAAAHEAGEDALQSFLDQLETEAAARRNARRARERNRQGGEVSPVIRAAPGLQGDELVRVGNFLGTSQDALTRIAERTNDLLAGILENTRVVAQSVGSGDLSFPT